MSITVRDNSIVMDKVILQQRYLPEMSITIKDNSIVMDKVKLITGTSHDEKK